MTHILAAGVIVGIFTAFLFDSVPESIQTALVLVLGVLAYAGVESTAAKFRKRRP